MFTKLKGQSIYITDRAYISFGISTDARQTYFGQQNGNASIDFPDKLISGKLHVDQPIFMLLLPCPLSDVQMLFSCDSEYPAS
jgi:hypothetical protein